MAEKKTIPKAKKKPAKVKNTKKSTKTKTTKLKSKNKIKTSQQEDYGDGIAIIDDDLSIDQEKINEERRAYLEEARSQEASD